MGSGKRYVGYLQFVDCARCFAAQVWEGGRVHKRHEAATHASRLKTQNSHIRLNFEFQANLQLLLLVVLSTGYEDKDLFIASFTCNCKFQPQRLRFILGLE